jgi:hypothetical protein
MAQIPSTHNQVSIIKHKIKEPNTITIINIQITERTMRISITGGNSVNIINMASTAITTTMSSTHIIPT